MPRKSKRRKEEICEDYCFRCKDGGAVRICDYKDCLKVYHPQCVEKDDSFLKSKDRWTCNRHSCFICQRIPKFYCFCCPQAVCGRCLCDAEFAVVKGSEGFCNHCLKLAIMIEENVDVDSDGGRVDFKERNTFEFLFMEYWEIIKEKQGLSSEQVYSAKDLLKNGKNHTPDSDFDLNEISQEEESFTESDEESDDENWKDREEYMPVGKKKRSKGNQCAMKRKAKATKIEFRGWGSKSLLEFLISIGKDTTKELSQNEVTTIVSNYCKEHNLFHPQKKKTVMCDPMLQSLLGKKSININRLYNLLDAHFAENLDLTEEDETDSSSEDNDKNLMVTCNRQPKLVSDRQPQKTNVVPLVRKTCFASIVAENIKLVYLKRSLVEDLLKQPETFDEKVVGSFVRVKSDPNDYSQKNSHQLLQVKGIRKTSSNGEMNTEIFMQLVNMPKDVQVCELSNDDFCEEECKDLHQRVKEGKLKRPTIVELEQKARCLHKDITERWIARELSLLQKRIDQANEKGWRRELEQYLDKKLLLEKPSEQFRLINEVPEVIADIEKLEPTSENSLSQDQTEHDGSPESAPRAKWSSQTPRTGLANRTVYHAKGGTDPSVFAGTEKFKPTPESSPRKDKQECDGFPASAFKGSCPTPNTNLVNVTLCLSNGGTDPAGLF
ncbi:zinc finger CCCH domain-containing protein 19 isoform X3 [Pyrus x bretschneideri]|uniref:zinc finger CCCH domain-containing protein 19 isoform X3 n=1 Tax=Pyrus x bretschneideri TaxID=225117 RepID=UPI0020304984|nr:zinc finger CCCH domain-containing protein 19 isoform X3 [Pyrus x bretschneideri]